MEMNKLMEFNKRDVKLTPKTLKDLAFAGNQNFKSKIDGVVELKDGSKNGKSAADPAKTAPNTNGKTKSQTLTNTSSKELMKKPAETEMEKNDYEKNMDDNFGKGMIPQGIYC